MLYGCKLAGMDLKSSVGVRVRGSPLKSSGFRGLEGDRVGSSALGYSCAIDWLVGADYEICVD